ncbi:VTT domain-containing protein [Desulfobulbus sp.]|uniref:VTT domain-containing protein n=1 Tax=Desulfobulbus sp. TaxID=895 RepID=UPI00286F7C66|nr:VTT domain-containing protein [Desulfobulbus sp.]
MELIRHMVELTVNINQHLTVLVQHHGVLIYGLIALIIFCEVGLVVAPFLPGDSMLFAIGTLCASDAMDLEIVLVLFPLAAILGDNFNRLMGCWFGHKAFAGRHGYFFNQGNLDRAHHFFEKYGTKAVTLCRFVPFLRTYVPFVAGMAEMRLRVFFPYSVLGGTGWVAICVLAGYFFGNLDVLDRLACLQ